MAAFLSNTCIHDTPWIFTSIHPFCILIAFFKAADNGRPAWPNPTNGFHMPDKEQLNRKLESLSMDFILLEPEDTEKLISLVNDLRDLEVWANDNNQPVLSLTIQRFSEFAHRHFSHQNIARDTFLSILEELLSDLQTHARKNDDFRKLNIIEKIDRLDPISPEARNLNASGSGMDSSLPHLRPPATLPSHLNLALFNEFLELQTSALDQMEASLLAFEKTSDSEHIQNLKRLVHTQKGEAGFLGQRDVEMLFHGMEDFLDSDSVFVHSDLLFSAIDWTRKNNAWHKGYIEDQPEPPHTICQAFLDHASSLSDQAEHKNEAGTDTLFPASGKIPMPAENLSRQTIRVETECLDRLIDMIGELVIAEAMVTQSKEIQAIQSQDLMKNIGRLNAVTRALHEACLTLRMVPLKDTFQKMERLVRDIAKKSGKLILCHIQGEDTKLDKTLVDQIGESLLHIIRNAADHGIEASQEERIARGKPAHGSIHIRAFQKNGYVCIEINDDGRGIDTASILQKARDTGRIRPDQTLAEQNIFNLIFEPGFSTAEKITDLSGRGLGMNVVKRVVESLQGHIACRSERGQGCTFTIKIPLTLSMIDGMVVKVDQERFIVPTLSIVTASRIDQSQVTKMISGEKTVLFQGRLVPILDLGLRFSTKKSESQTGSPGLMVVVESSSSRIALAVDDIIGKQQVVVKSLGLGMIQNPGISGAAIMNDGTVGLVLDIDRLTHGS